MGDLPAIFYVINRRKLSRNQKNKDCIATLKTNMEHQPEGDSEETPGNTVDNTQNGGDENDTGELNESYDHGEEVRLVNNSLLTYVQYYIHRSTAENIRKAVVRFYGAEAICKAKTVMWDAASDFSILGRRQTRQNSVARSAHEADAMDIITGMQKLDKYNGLPLKFVHWDLKDIPKYAPDECEPGMTAERFAQQDQRIAAVEHQAEGNADTIRALQLTVYDLVTELREKQVLSSVQTPPMNYSGAVAGNLQGNQRRQTAVTQVPITTGQGARAKNPAGRMPPAGARGRSQASGAGSARNSQPGEEMQQAGRGQHDPNSSGDLESGYERQPQERRRLRRQQQKNVITGSKKETTIKSGAKYTELFVSRIHRDVDVDTISSYITNEGVAVQSIEKLSNSEARMQSFKVKILTDDCPKAMESAFWPEGVCCRKYWNRNKSVNGAHF